jgi:hypothetical protein
VEKGRKTIVRGVTDPLASLSLPFLILDQTAALVAALSAHLRAFRDKLLPGQGNSKDPP